MPNTVTIPRSAFSFLKSLKANNNRPWFEAHKEEYLGNLAVLEAFADGLLAGLNTHDRLETPSGKKSLYRIYRDVRFSKDKSPYKIYWGGHFTRAGRQRRGGYYYHFEPGNSRITGAFWGPSAPDLRLIREDIAFDDRPLRKIITAKKFVDAFGTLQGEQLQRVPAGFDPAHPAADLLRYKQYLVIKTFTDKEVHSPDFLQQATEAFHRMRPFLDHMSMILCTDANGEIADQ
ncbi:MAG TPA: DUF2461 domain-containing protein [Puia sp.]|uniref:DUF2461 domain-containing protein n=1 Tax=Puia sp. TaxID=2045100 RepID=UPI002CA9E450|nr:DUF2461 domain-containing protein [Puia sp.]HVU94062.1 DUF2461 domain-containing protein [Puia sp.]